MSDSEEGSGVNISPVLSLWVQLGSLFFVLSGISADLLLIRSFLFMGYVFLFLNAVLGGPLWPHLSIPNYVAVDSLVWACLGLYIHGTSAIALFRDELPIHLTEDETALWRMFYRSGGLSKKLFKTLVSNKFTVEEFAAGDCITSDTHFNILYKGLVSITILDNETEEFISARTVFSGEMFDCSDLQQFAQNGFFSKHRVNAMARSYCKVFRIKIDDMKIIANQRFAKGIMQTMLIDAMEGIIEAFSNGGEKPVPPRVKEMEKELESMDLPRHPSQRDDGNVYDIPVDGDDDSAIGSFERSKRRYYNALTAEYIAPEFCPLQDWELPEPLVAGSGQAWKHPIQHLLKYFVSFLGPPPPFGGHPTGIRHTLLPAPSRHANYQPSKQ